MKQFLLKAIKVFLFITAIILAFLLIFGLVFRLNWPWWMGIFMALGLAGLGVGSLFLRKIWLRHREQHFVQQIIEQDQMSLKNLGAGEKDQSKELQEKWKEAIAALKRSHLKKSGNPLYVLPWYLVIGESGSGKTTALQSARLSSPFAEVTRTSGISGTRNCDWWFFEQAIIIDTAGRYAIPIDEGRDKDEWQNFLNLLAKYRKREPLNGLLVTIAADKLLEARPEVIEEDSTAIHRRIDELMRVLGVTFPVYVLVTKCDLIQGMTQFCDHLPEKSLDQAMGFINQNFSKDVAAFQDQAFATIGERLRDHRILLVNELGSKSQGASVAQRAPVAQGAPGDPALLLFPEELERLRPGLDIFLKRVFQENPYQETPTLRGLFLSSGRQEGTPYSHFLQALGLTSEREVLPGTNKGLFLHDFFARILPKERSLLAPTRHSLELSRMTRNLGLISWLALMSAICGLLSFSFFMNVKTLRQVFHEFSIPAEQRSTMAQVAPGTKVVPGAQIAPVAEDLTDLAALDRFRQTALKVQSLNQNWWIPTFGLHESRGIETGLKSKYCQRFQNAFLAPFDERLKIKRLSGSNSDQAIRQQVSYLVRRINLLKTRLEGHGGQDLETLQAIPQPSSAWTQAAPVAQAPGAQGASAPVSQRTPVADVSVAGNQQITPETGKTIDTLYLHYLIWNTDSGQIEQEMHAQQERLRDILTGEGTDLHWLVNCVDTVQPGVNRADLWGSSQQNERGGEADNLTSDDHTSVAPAFTAKGKEQIDSFLGEVESALPDPSIMAEKKSAFLAWYYQAYLKAWYDFGLDFPKGAAQLKTKEERRQMAVKIATGTGPYQVLLNTMSRELEPLPLAQGIPATQGATAAVEQAPTWLLLVYQLQSVKTQATREDPAKEKGILDKVTDQGKKLVSSLENKIGKQNGLTPEAQSLATQGYLEYIHALAETAPALTSSTQAYQMAAQVYSEELATGKNSFFCASRAIDKLKASLLSGRGLMDEMFWKLISGSPDYLWAFVNSETACYLQNQWEQEVLTEIGGISGLKNVQEFILGPDGFVSKFVKGKAGPFISRSLGKGYYAKEVGGRKIPFIDSFFSFLNKGTMAAAKTVKGNYFVIIKGLPTSANPEAKVSPDTTRLELTCASGLQSIVNRNYPTTKTFNWTPDSCGEVIFRIQFQSDMAEELTLTKKYTGDQAFARFLGDFPGGKHTFSADDFPEQKARLKSLGIRYIKAEYEFSGQHQSILSLLQNVPTQVPQKIILCEDQEK